LGLPGVVNVFFDKYAAVLAADVEDVAKVDPAQALCTVNGSPTARKVGQLVIIERRQDTSQVLECFACLLGSEAV
jgi:hypothetical protein